MCSLVDKQNCRFRLLAESTVGAAGCCFCAKRSSPGCHGSTTRAAERIASDGTRTSTLLPRLHAASFTCRSTNERARSLRRSSARKSRRPSFFNSDCDPQIAPRASPRSSDTTTRHKTLSSTYSACQAAAPNAKAVSTSAARPTCRALRRLVRTSSALCWNSRRSSAPARTSPCSSRGGLGPRGRPRRHLGTAALACAPAGAAARSGRPCTAVTIGGGWPGGS